MTDLRKAAEMALDYIKDIRDHCACEGIECEKEDGLVEALRQALAQPEQEPVAWIMDGELFFMHEYQTIAEPNDGAKPLYTAPPSKPEQGCCECGVTVSEGYALYCVKCVEPLFAKEWVSLTDEEMEDCWNNLIATPDFSRKTVYQAIEAALKEKNNG